MIKTEEQRRWWFATHPEFSKRAGGRARGYGGGNKASSGVSPKDVDSYVDEALKYETGTTAELLKALKSLFGTEFEAKTPEQQHALLWGEDEPPSSDDERADEQREWPSGQSSGHPAADRDTYDKYEDVLDRTRPGDLEALEWNEQIRQQDSIGLESDPHTLLDLAPYRRFITSPIGALKDLFRSTARDAVLSATKKSGDRWKFEDDPSETTRVRASISRTKHPEAAQHVEDAQAAGQPSELTIDRSGARRRGREALRDYPPESGKDRDEYPPKMFKEGGKGASLRRISPTDNRGTGASIGNQLRRNPDGTKVKIEVVD